MCCFSRPVESVTGTKIFARGFPRGPDQERQFIVYSMSIKAREELAMVLPIPVKGRSGDDAVHFISLKEYSTLFDALEAGFSPYPKAGVSSLTRKSTATAWNFKAR